ncbi:hypothetical protein CAEBREN_32863 [Caenorhabditis brenneri]|uniref:Integrase catalytic domain-containing protein n=1 Tax=Caenorhabditis brenneri TaxID=135651 RepID=G0ND29_CAEBE|nr:hypothetical protein CAEBREN_32863 [Caenorhabditis brenneri]
MPHSHGASPTSTGTGNASRTPHFPTNPQPFGSNPGFNPNFNAGFNNGCNTGFNNGSNPSGNTRFNTGYNPRANMFNNNNGFNQSNPVAGNQRMSREELEMHIKLEQAKSSFLTSSMSALKPFSGEACDYPTFMAQFDALVHNNSFADVQMKQTILTNLLPSALAREHQTTEISEEKYQMIRHNLERQFNRHYSQFNLMRKDIERITFPADNLEKLQSALNTYSTLAYKLQSFGVNPNDRFFIAALADKLPNELRRAAMKMLSYGQPSLNDVMNKIYDIVATETGAGKSSPKLSLGYDENYVNSIAINAVSKSQARTWQTSAKSKGAKAKSSFVAPSKEKPCRYCDEDDHCAAECKIPYEQKRKAVQRKELCYNCLSEKHTVIECKSKFNCVNCQKRHFTAASNTNFQTPQPSITLNTIQVSDDEGDKDRSESCSTNSFVEEDDSIKLLPSTLVCNTFTTAEQFTQLLDAFDIDVDPQLQEPMRMKVYKVSDTQAQLPFIQLHTPTGGTLLALVDTGAQTSIISTQAAEKLQLQIVGRRKMLYSGFISQTPERWCTFYRLELLDLSGNSWTTCLPSYDQMSITFSAPEHTLEDQSFIKRNGLDCEGVTNLQDFDGQKIDMILGNNVLNKVKDIQKANTFYLPSRRAIEHLLVGFVHHPPILDDSFVPIDRNKPLSISDDTKEIWINTISIEDVTTAPADEDNSNNVSTRKLDRLLERLWTLDVLGLMPPTVKDSKDALNADLISEFKKSAIMDKDNKIYVTWPFNGRQDELKNNFPVAKIRLQSLLERQLAKTEDRKEYHDIITKQVEEGIVEEIDLSSKSTGPEYYIPHRVVVKEDSLTTKLRIVLDASSHMKNELSLNDCLHPGPSILQPILGIMIRSRLSKFLLMSDIQRAFHQVRIQEQVRDVTKFLWIADPNKGFTEENLRAFRFTRLPFGVSSSPFLLAVTILRYLEINENSLNERIKENLYVDNVILTSNDEEDIKECYKQSKAIFNLMHMNLRDYLSNSPSVMGEVAEQDRHPDHVCKLLGHQWNSTSDTIIVKIAKPPKGVPTKKQLVAFSARNYDPSGIITPIIVPVKQLISSMWSRDIKWKEKIPEDLVPAWNAIKEQFTDTTYSIPRQLTTNYDFSSAQLIVFCDASKAHYATAAYIRYGYKDDTFTSGLIFSKSRIRPSNGGLEYTIPRMELMALEIGSNAAVNLAKELHMDLKNVVLFSDSTCCLSGSSAKKQAAETGLVPELSTYALGVQSVVNKVSNSVPQHAIPYERTYSMHKLTIWMTRALQWICRLIQRRNKRHPDNPIQFKDNLLALFWSAFEAKDPLGEADLVRKLIIKCHYKDAEERFNEFPPQRLFPILHEDGSWRYKTRFSDSTDSRLKEDMRFPIIIISNHPLAKLLVYESHEKLQHQGIQDVISDIHQRYWIEHLGRIVRAVRAHCFLCQRKHGKTFKYNFNRILPASRTTFVGPFQFVGLDYIGPLQYKRSDGQGKLWILLVSCIFTRAVHLEVVPDNTTVSFINGLRRFISRRGAPQFILSDNAPLFKLAYSIINEDLKTIVNENEELTSYLAQKQIKIKLITPLSPWQGGAYERLVGLVKNVIQKVLSKEIRSFLEMETLVIDTEGIINSRPVTPNKRAEEDAPAIRPCDFLNPGVQLALPEKVDSVFGVIKPGETEKLTRSLLEGLGKAKEDLWDQFALSYFQTLRELKEDGANHSAQTPKPGMIVLVESAKTKSRHHWPLGRIISVSRSMDGAPRSVLVKCGKHILEKPVNQLVPLEDPGDNEDETKISVPQLPPTTSYPRITLPQQDQESLQTPPALSTSQPDAPVQPKKKRGRPPKSKTTSSAPQPTPSASSISTTPKESQEASAHAGNRVQSTTKPASAPRHRVFLPRSAKASTQAQVSTDLANDDGTSTFLQNVDPPPPGVSRP